MNYRTTMTAPVAFSKAKVSLLASLFFLLIAYFQIVINPQLYYSAQHPVFFFDKYFFRDFLVYPGGLVDYLSALVSQFYFFPLIGAVIIAALVVLLIFLFSLYLEKTVGEFTVGWSIIPMLPLLLSYNKLGMALVFIIALIFGTALALVLASLVKSRTRLLVFFLGGALLYYAAGFSFFYFAVLAILYELIKNKKYIHSVVYLGGALIFPWVSGTFLFLVTLQSAFMHPFESSIQLFPLLLFISFPAITAVLYIIRLLKIQINSSIVRLGLSVVVLLFTIGISSLRMDKKEKQFWQINHYAQMHQWDQVIESFDKQPSNNIQIKFQVNRALCQLGKMGDEYFRYNRKFNKRDFYLLDEEFLSSPLIYSDYYFDLHHYVEAAHWAYEALSMEGETGWILERLAKVHILTGDYKIAAKYLAKLEKTIVFKKRAREHKPMTMDPSKIAAHPQFSLLAAQKITADFLTFYDGPEKYLKEILKQHPDNRAAFDYYMLDLLASKKLALFVEELQKNDSFAFNPLPRHFQEALFLYASIHSKNESGVKNLNISVDVLKKFNNFKSDYLKVQNDKQKAKRVLLKEYGNTYWYYYIFTDLSGSA